MRSCHRINKKKYEQVKSLLERDGVDMVVQYLPLSKYSIVKIKNSTSYREFAADRRWATARAKGRREGVKISIFRSEPVVHQSLWQRCINYLFQ